jgi:hypothetical protein
MRHRRISLLHLHGTLGRLMGKRATALLGFGIASILAVALAIALVLREDGPDHPETVIVPGSNATDLQMRFDLMRSRGPASRDSGANALLSHLLAGGSIADRPGS